MESITPTDLNLLVLRYLMESGFTDTASKVGHEARVQNNNTDGNPVPYGAMITLVQKGLLFLELGANLDVDVNNWDQELISLRKIIKERRRKLQEDNDKEKREKGQEQDMQVDVKEASIGRSEASMDVNSLVLQYLIESGFNHSAVTFGHEAHVHNNNTDGDLVTLVQKGLQYLELEANLDAEDFSFFKPPELISTSTNELRQIIEERRRKLQEDNDAKGKQVQDMQGDGKGPGETDAAASSSHAHKIASSDVVKLEGHTDEVFSCAWSPAGSVLASGSGDGSRAHGKLLNVRVLTHSTGVLTADWNINADPGPIKLCDGNGKKKRDIIFALSTDAVSVLKKAVLVMGKIGADNVGVHADEDGLKMQISNATSSIVIDWEINSKAFTTTTLTHKLEKWAFLVESVRTVLDSKKDIAEKLHVTIDRNRKKILFLFEDDEEKTYVRREVASLMRYPAEKTRCRERDLLGCVEECYEIKSTSLCSILRELKAKDLSSVRLDIGKQNVSFSFSGTTIDIPLKEPPVLLASGVQLIYGEAVDALIESIEVAEEFMMLAVGHGLVVMLKIPVRYGICTFFFKHKVVAVVE